MWCGEGRSLWLLSDSAGKLFYSTDAEVLGDDEVVELDLALRILDLQEGAGMAHIDEALRQPKLDLSGELEQADVVADSDALLPDALSELCLSQTVLLDELLVGQGYFDSVEVFALDVLDESKLQQFAFLCRADVCGERLQSSQLGCTPATLTRDDLVRARGEGLYGDGLYKTESTQGGCELLEAFLLEVLTGLIGVGGDLLQRKLLDRNGALEGR